MQHHLFCFELSGHCDDGRPHQTIFSHHDRVQSHLPVQGLRLATKTSTPVYINGTLLKFPLVFPPSAMSYGLLCLAMSYLTHLMGDSVLQASLQEVVVIVEQRRVCPAFLSDLCTVWTSGGFENLRDGWRAHPGCVLPWPVLPLRQFHCKLPLVRKKTSGPSACLVGGAKTRLFHRAEPTAECLCCKYECPLWHRIQVVSSGVCKKFKQAKKGQSDRLPSLLALTG